MSAKNTKQSAKKKSGLIIKDSGAKMPASYHAIKKNPDKYKNKKV